ncbi:hypothetical protein GCM10028774_61370 [Spirosoma jeollabukense]
MPNESIAVTSTIDFLPDWLTDEENLRDEGVLFGLSDARPDEKIAEIRSLFSQQAAPLERLLEQHTGKLSELNGLIEQQENLITSLRGQSSALRDKNPASNNLIRTMISLLLSGLMCIGNFYLIDETLRPAFPNRWIGAGVFLAGMFNLFGRTSFFYETDTRLSGRRLVEEIGLPVATSVFVLVQAWQTQSAGQALALGVFVFFLFLLAGKLLLSTLTTLQADIDNIQANRELLLHKEQNLPVWEAQITQLTREVETIRTQKWPIVTTLTHIEADLTRLNARLDGLVNLFLSEFELARSVRDQLTQQQREAIFN